ncbi:MAG: hypothetical protein M3O36_05775 [Myxococcota bacterium]|nr:hypothetical protein [Myxococcota bacterium]
MEASTAVPETGAPGEAGSGGTEGGAREGGAGGDGGGATFTAVYAIITTSCLPCHATGGGATGGMLDMSTQATAYTNLVGKTAAGSACAATGGTRVVPGMATASLLYNKVSVATPRCGMRMPRGAAPLPAADVMLIRSWINAGALND